MSARLDRLSLLETFARIVERGSISAAARDLGMSQASASRQLAQLEERIGTPLLVRTTHSMSVTEQGAQVLASGRRLLAGWDDLLEEARDDGVELTGALKVIAPVALGQLYLTRAALDFQVAHPGVDVTWLLDDSEIRFAEVGCDLWIRIGRPLDDTLIVSEVAHVERLVVATPSISQKLGSPHPKALKGLPNVALAPFEGSSIPLSDGFQTVKVEAENVLTTNNIFSLRQAALGGIGYAVLPRWMIADELYSGELVDLLPGWRAPELAITSCLLPTHRHSRRLNAMRETLIDAIAKVPGITVREGKA